MDTPPRIHYKWFKINPGPLACRSMFLAFVTRGLLHCSFRSPKAKWLVNLVHMINGHVDSHIPTTPPRRQQNIRRPCKSAIHRLLPFVSYPGIPEHLANVILSA